jgi:hypothetical protein
MEWAAAKMAAVDHFAGSHTVMDVEPYIWQIRQSADVDSRTNCQ